MSKDTEARDILETYRHATLALAAADQLILKVASYEGLKGSGLEPQLGLPKEMDPCEFDRWLHDVARSAMLACEGMRQTVELLYLALAARDSTVSVGNQPGAERAN